MRTDYAPCSAMTLPLRRRCVVEYFAALHEYLLRQHDDHRHKRYILLFVLIIFIVLDLSQTQAAVGSREWQLTVPEGLVRWMQPIVSLFPGALLAWLLWRHNAFLVTCFTALERITAAQRAQELLYAAIYAARTQ